MTYLSDVLGGLVLGTLDVFLVQLLRLLHVLLVNLELSSFTDNALFLLDRKRSEPTRIS